MTIPKILFILKKRQTYQATNYPTTMHSGLYNSASFVNEMLNESGFESHLVEVIDNNCIDKEVTKYKVIKDHIIGKYLYKVKIRWGFSTQNYFLLSLLAYNFHIPGY